MTLDIRVVESDAPVVLEACERAYIVRPGDSVILSTDRPLSMQEAAQIKERAVALLPESVKILVVGGGVTVTIARGDKGEPA